MLLALKLSVLVVVDVDSHDGASLSVRSGKRELEIFMFFMQILLKSVGK